MRAAHALLIPSSPPQGGGKGEGDGRAQEGEGLGFGGVVRPVGVYEIRGEAVRFVPAIDATLLAVAAIAAVTLVAFVALAPRLRRRVAPAAIES